MVRWTRSLAVVLLSFTGWVVWRSHPTGKGALVLPLLFFIIVFLGVSASALWPSPSRYSRNWINTFPLAIALLCTAFFLGQLVATYTAWLR